MDQFKSIWPDWKDERIYAILVTGILLVAFLAMITSMFKNMAETNRVGLAPDMPRSITINGEGKVVAVPDISTIDLGVTISKPTQEAAVTEVTNKMNELVNKLRALGIKDADLNPQQYSVYPKYDYPDGRERLTGYQATQQVNVKVRDAKLLGSVLKTAGDAGANQIGDLRRTVDEPEPYKKEARLKAIANAKDRAQALASALGVRFIRVLSYYESSTDGQPYPYYSKAEMGLGGGGVPTPDIPSGSQEILSTVTITFEIQ